MSYPAPLHIVKSKRSFYCGTPFNPRWRHATVDEFKRIKPKLKSWEPCNLCVKNLEGSKP